MDREGFLTPRPDPNPEDQDFMSGFTLLGELFHDELGQFHKILYVFHVTCIQTAEKLF
jgi:hypothetical protein